LREGYEEKIEVEEEFKLFIEYERQEREYIVFLVPDNIGRKTRLQFVCATSGTVNNKAILTTYLAVEMVPFWTYLWQFLGDVSGASSAVSIKTT
jgi:hypothetical protein